MVTITTSNRAEIVVVKGRPSSITFRRQTRAGRQTTRFLLTTEGAMKESMARVKISSVLETTFGRARGKATR